jgi:hypothetical protein
LLVIVGYWSVDIVPIAANSGLASVVFAGSFLGLAYAATDYCYIVILLVKTMKSVRTGTALGETQKLPRDIIL